jgi:hypothetical protein
MTYPRVNLLKKNEQRYQGAVSRRFMFVSIVVTPILFIAIISGVKLIQYSSARSDLKASQGLWTDLQPRLSLHKDQKNSLKDNQQVLELLDSWQASQVAMDLLLTEVQTVVPNNIQLRRLSVRGDVKTSVYEDPQKLGLSYNLMIQGYSQGQYAEDAVIELRKNLLSREYLNSTFDSVKLASMRKRAGLNGQNMREFSLEGLSEKGGAK